MNRVWSSIALYFPAMPARSPVGEWQVEHLPAPLNQALPAFAVSPKKSLTRMSGGLGPDELFSYVWTRSRMNETTSLTCSGARLAAGVVACGPDLITPAIAE